MAHTLHQQKQSCRLTVQLFIFTVILEAHFAGSALVDTSTVLLLHNAVNGTEIQRCAKVLSNPYFLNIAMKT